jgi:hypothetical protein
MGWPALGRALWPATGSGRLWGQDFHASALSARDTSSV